MAWVRLDDGFWRHPKVLGLPANAFQLHIAALCWSAEQRTDGYLTKASLVHIRAVLWQRSGSRVAARLVEAGLWEKAPDGSDWQYRIHDFLDYNPSREQVERERARWRGYKTKVADSTAVSTAETHETQDAFPRPPVPVPVVKDLSTSSLSLYTVVGDAETERERPIYATTDTDDDGRFNPLDAFTAGKDHPEWRAATIEAQRAELERRGLL
jgi:hypothetical protein